MSGAPLSRVGCYLCLEDSSVRPAASFSGKQGSKLTCFEGWFPTLSQSSLRTPGASCRWQAGREDGTWAIQGSPWRSVASAAEKAQVLAGMDVRSQGPTGVPARPASSAAPRVSAQNLTALAACCLQFPINRADCAGRKANLSGTHTEQGLFLLQWQQQ